MGYSRKEYEEITKNFTELTIDAVEERLKKGEPTILFVGKPTCPFCQMFVPKLNHVAQQNNLDIYYLNSIDTETTPAIKALRNRMGISTVPQVVTIDGEDTYTNLNIESSTSEEKLTELLSK
ncbi:thioredoxin fold domain-containing protein [Jeotgalibaca sp. MA1X17-3]|uniref:thioredoxin fold domain-containing protein n=1 Tax=Jeotgalibaca sp. MA1X17-3 TaxID=2908211 RepID=UPI001F17583E|nr:thioredoxin fold domain-containing protein [Jeotgalibaca sp. MA1X17-3]UJF15921.1 thioredoxin fold domain-containing protein [Jeotgalibaca sp. MA1X17-3]